MPLKFLLSKFKFIGIFSVGVSSQTFKGHTHRVFDSPSPFPLLADSVGQPFKKEKKQKQNNCPTEPMCVFACYIYTGNCFLTFHLQDLICNSPYCLFYNSYDVSVENLVWIS